MLIFCDAIYQNGLLNKRSEMKAQTPNYTNYATLLIVVSAMVRGVLAGWLELGNDEVYYRLYALCPDWSYFDHPLMVGWTIRLFSLDLLFSHEFFIRLGSVILGSVNTWIMFLIGKNLYNARAGWFAALLYTSSVYGFVITGTFILPDTPQGLFWLWSLLIMLQTLPFSPDNSNVRRNFLLLGFLLGLGILSKYTVVFLWGGTVLYLLIYNRRWFKSLYFYYALAITAVLMLPLLIWNLQNDFISFTFHGNRVNTAGFVFRPDYFLTEIMGEFLYNNPINFVLIVLAVGVAFKGKLAADPKKTRVILLMGLPLIAVFLFFSLFRSTLPHWTAPGYTTLIPLAAVWLAAKPSLKTIPGIIQSALALLIFTLILGMLQIRTGLIPLDSTTTYENLGEDDPSLDMFGYREAGKAFEQIVSRDMQTGEMLPSSLLVGNNWFPLANYDYYAATPANLKSMAIGTLDKIHVYAWINRAEGGFVTGNDAYYITDSRDFRPPDSLMRSYFEQVIPADTIEIQRGGKPAKRIFIFQMKNLQRIPDDPLLR